MPERMDNILQTQKLCNVPDENIFIDYNHDGCKPTAKRAWLKKTDKSHVLVLQDDIILCDRFMYYCDIIVNTHPDAIVGLFPILYNTHKIVKHFPSKSPYVLSQELSGQGIIMRTDYVKPCIKAWRDDIPGDDVNIHKWADDTGKVILTTLPSLLRHIGVVSVFDPSRTIPDTPFFNPNPSNMKWGDKRITPWWEVDR